MRGGDDGVEIVFAEDLMISRILEEPGDGVLKDGQLHESREMDDRRAEHTLDMSLNTEFWASSNRRATSFKLSTMAWSSPTALVIRLARLLRRL